MASLRALFFTDPLVIVATIVYGAVSLLSSFFDATGRTQAAIAAAWARALLRICGVRVTVHGLEHIAPDGVYVFAGNHASFIDTPVVLARLPVQFRFLAKRGLFRIPFLGWHLERAGHIPVFRENARARLKTLTMAADTVQQHRISLLIFPEGGRSMTGKLREFTDGAAYIAIKAGAPIVPLTLKGTRESLPMGSWVVRPAHVEMFVGEPIPTEGLTQRDRATLTAQVREQVAAELTPPARTTASAAQGSRTT
jgi:1-acyl-sn-glycerol-3-phosphate acyltransferase